MSFSYFLAKRFGANRSKNKTRKRSSINIATFGITVGLTVMIVAISVVIGFKREVRAQIVGFGSHVQISSYSGSSSFDRQPITIDSLTNLSLKGIPAVSKIEPIVTKPGIIKTDNNFKGVVFKGVNENYDWSFYKKNLVEGSVLDFTQAANQNNILISDKLAKQLNIKLGDDIFAYFFQQQVRARKFRIVGVYATTFSEFDNLFVICNLSVIQSLNQWDSTRISSVEIMLSDFDLLEQTTGEIESIVGNKFDDNRLIYNTQSIKELYPQIFNWLEMLNINAYIILILMMAVAGFNMISGLLIIILEKTQTIGILKALGMKNRDIRKVFVLNALFFVARGMFWGNLIGLLAVLLQKYFRIIPLNPEYYYTDFVPVAINLWWIALLNVAVFVLSIAIMVLPSQIITQISPAKSIKFE